MTITLKRQLTDDEKQIVLKQHGRTCYATGHAISEDDQVQFDHIKAFSLGGASDTANIAPMCATHNKEKGQLSLFDFRTKLRLKEFFSQGDKLTLKDLLEYLKVKKEIKEYGQLVTSVESDGTINISSAHSSFTTTLQTCPATGWKYFYYILDVELLNSDDDEDGAIGLQPRYLIEDNAIKQAYLCKAPSNQVHAGDIVLFYRSKDEMAVTTIGVVERYETHTEATKIMQLVSRRTVYSQSEIEAMTNTSVRVMLFRLIGHLKNPIPLASLKRDANVSGKLMSITKISDDSFSRILRLS